MRFSKKYPTILLKIAWYYFNLKLRSNVSERRIYTRSFYLNYFKFIKSNTQNNQKNLNSIDIIIPVIERDFEVLNLAVSSLRIFCNNPIKNIYLVSPNSERIKEFAKKSNCKFIDETVIINRFQKLNYIVKGVDRSGWLLQQFIKLSWDKISGNQYCLIFDADIILLRKHSFVNDGIMNFNCSDEYHTPYFATYYKLLGLQPELPISLVGHYMVFERETTNSLKNAIRHFTGLSWSEAIIKQTDFTESSGFSEYETYGHYMNKYFTSKIRIAYHYNLSLNREALCDLSSLVKKHAGNYSTASFHWHT